jgi:hypothetical protein
MCRRFPRRDLQLNTHPEQLRAMCVAKEDFQCTGRSLEVCADDGQSFVKQMDCDTEALCNATAGMCTPGACIPGKVSCNNNTLTKCNAMGTGFDINKPCGMGVCDVDGADCNICQPGTTMCQGEMVMTCDPTGQMLTPTPCPSGQHCMGMGQCVECTSDNDCSALTQGCVVGMCDANKCGTKDASSSTM